MVQKTTEKSKAPPMSLTFRAKATSSPGASHMQRKGTGMAQEPRLASHNEPSREGSNHPRVPDQVKRDSVNVLSSRPSVVVDGSTSTTRAVASESVRRSSDTDSIELLSDAEHPHARDIYKHMQEFQKPFDGEEDKPNVHWKGRA